jgi:predicted transport protein
MATTPEEQTAKMIESLAEKTGKPMDAWLALAKKSGKSKHGELVSWLKAEHAVTHGYANLIAHFTFKNDAGSMLADGADLESAMFTGGKEGLRPIYDALMKHITSFGTDIEKAPKKGYMSLRRATQFATLHPSTKTRFDIGLKLKGVSPDGKLEAAGSWNAMVTHRIRLESVADIDADVQRWLRAAYDGAK